jgi:hypothetical protein
LFDSFAEIFFKALGSIAGTSTGLARLGRQALCVLINMSTRRFYIYKAENCLTAAAAADPVERATFLRLAASYMLLADYVSAREERAAAYRMEVPEYVAADARVESG